MSDIDRYQPPHAGVGYAARETYSTPRFWSRHGRIGRLRFLAYITGSYFVLAMVMGVLAGPAPGSGSLLDLIELFALVASVVFSLLTAIKRSHDMGWSGWTALGTLIPFVALIWVFKRGDDGANRYGAPPPPSTLGIKILGLLMPVLFVLGVLLAIVLPAYQGYQLREQSPQIRSL